MNNNNEIKEMSHLDLLRIDAVRAGEGTAREEEHVGDCTVCRAALEDLKTAADSLKISVSPQVVVPPEVDRALMTEFRRKFTGRREPVRILFPGNWKSWAAPALGVAAAVMLVLAVTIPGVRKITGPHFRLSEMVEQPSAVVIDRAKGDVNGDGRVDILDAYRLAVFIGQKSGTSPAWDMNRDGRVDLLDVDTVARLAVAL